MGKTHAPYPREFREEAVRLVRQSSKSIPQIAKELGVSHQSLRNWVKRATVNEMALQSDPSPRSLHPDNAVSMAWNNRTLETVKQEAPIDRGLAFPLAIILGVITGLVLVVARTGVEQVWRGLSVVPPSGKATSPQVSASGWTMLREGRLQEAQDMFLETLQMQPDQPDVWHGLVIVRTRMAQRDPMVLRQQARIYEDAMRRGSDTKEHYTQSAMQLLARASYEAAVEIEGDLDNQ